MTCERAGGETGFLAKEVAGNERLQACAQPFLDLRVDRRLAAGSAWAIGPAELGMQPNAFVFDEGYDAGKDRCEIQPL